MFEKVILSIGSRNFAQTLLSSMNESFGVHQMALFRLKPSGPLENLMHEAEGDRASLKYSVENYLQRYYKRDPLYPYLRTSDSREVDVRAVNADQIYDSELYDRLYRPFSIAGKICLIVRRPEDVLVASFFRTTSCGAYESSEHAKLIEYGGSLAAALERHLMLVTPSPEDLLSSLVDIFETLTIKVPLSAREAAVCARIVAGLSNEAIALDLDVSFHSVTTYRRRAYEKLGITASNELFGLVLRQRPLMTA